MFITYEILNILTQGTLGIVLAIIMILITAVAITRQWEKIAIIMLPIAIGLSGLGVGAGNTGLYTIIIIILTLTFVGSIWYDARQLGGLLTSRGKGLLSVFSKKVAERNKALENANKKLNEKIIKEGKEKLKVFENNSQIDFMNALGTMAQTAKKEQKSKQRIKTMKEGINKKARELNYDIKKYYEE